MQIDLIPAIPTGAIKHTATAAGSTSTALPGLGNILRVYNPSTTVDAFINVGTGTRTAAATTTSTSTNLVCPAGKDEVFSIPGDQIYNFAAQAASDVVLEIGVFKGGS